MGIEHENENAGGRTVISADGFYADIRERSEYQVLNVTLDNPRDGTAWVSTYVACDVSGEGQSEWKFYSIEVYEDEAVAA